MIYAYSTWKFATMLIPKADTIPIIAPAMFTLCHLTTSSGNFFCLKTSFKNQYLTITFIPTGNKSWLNIGFVNPTYTKRSNSPISTKTVFSRINVEVMFRYNDQTWTIYREWAALFFPFLSLFSISIFVLKIKRSSQEIQNLLV